MVILHSSTVTSIYVISIRLLGIRLFSLSYENKLCCIDHLCEQKHRLHL